MPRIPRGQVAGHAYHVLNRGNGGAVVFHKDPDYAAFCDLLATAKRKFPVQIFGFCVMPNHFHLVLQPAHESALSPFMQWWMTSHVRAGLVDQAATWPWSSLHVPHLTDPCPVPGPADWPQWIDAPLFDHELTALRTCVNLQQPFGAPAWQERLASTLGLVSTLRPPVGQQEKVACPLFLLPRTARCVTIGVVLSASFNVSAAARMRRRTNTLDTSTPPITWPYSQIR